MAAIGPISPKAHGAWLGSGSGAAFSNVIIGLLQTYVTHAPLASSLVTSIYVVVPALLAFTGAYLAPPLSKAEATVTDLLNALPPSDRQAVLSALTSTVKIVAPAVDPGLPPSGA